MATFRDLSERLTGGGFAMFVREADVIDSVTVGPTTAGKPDALDGSGNSNWPELGKVIEFSIQTEKEVAEFMCPDTAGGYTRETEEVVLMDALEMTLDRVNDVFAELLFGIGEITLDTPQTPFGGSERAVTGWLKVQIRRRDGTDWTLFDLWGKLRLAEDTTSFTKDPLKPRLRFERIRPTSGDTINFPS